MFFLFLKSWKKGDVYPCLFSKKRKKRVFYFSFFFKALESCNLFLLFYNFSKKRARRNRSVFQKNTKKTALKPYSSHFFFKQDSHAFVSRFSESSLFFGSDFSFFSIFFLKCTAELEDFQNKFLQLKKVRFFEKSRKMAKSKKQLKKAYLPRFSWLWTTDLAVFWGVSLLKWETL